MFRSILVRALFLADLGGPPARRHRPSTSPSTWRSPGNRGREPRSVSGHTRPAGHDYSERRRRYCRHAVARALPRMRDCATPTSEQEAPPRMTAEQLLTADLPSVGAARSARIGTWCSPHPHQLRSSSSPAPTSSAGTSTPPCSAGAPETRALFPVNMEVQRSRLLRALVHVVQMVDQPDELVPFLEQLGRDHRKFGVFAEHYDAVGARAARRDRLVRRAGLDPRGRAGLDRRLRAWSPTRCAPRPRPSTARRPGWAGSSSTGASAGTSR